jgi:ribose transport system ATP-binding protein
MSTRSTVLRLTDVVKTFPGVAALKGVSLDVVEGEVHALVGENGAGKSTLMGVAAGSIVPDEGTVEIGGHLLEHSSPTASQALGLAVVYQHTTILEDLTVAENLVFAMPADRRPRMRDAVPWTRDRLAAVGARFDPEARATELGPAQRQLLEIAKALALEPRVLILDEPTESLARDESRLLFERIRGITSSGAAVVYISHRLPEVKAVADRLTVLRDGEARGTFSVDAISTDEIVRLIVGRSIDHVFPSKGEPPASDAVPLLEVRGLSGPRFHDVSLAVAPGEIVGLAGVEGNGQREFLRALAGVLPATGTILVGSRPIDLGEPADATRARLVHVPGDRHAEGLFLSLTVRENVSLLALERVASAGIVRRGRELALVATEIAELDIRTHSPEVSVATLSGGNQQKVMLARSLLAEPLVLLADEPTRGVDVGARVEIYRILREAAAAGRAVVVASADTLELQGLCDRVLVFSRGQVVRALQGDAVTERDITGAAIGSDRDRATVTEALRRALQVRRFAAGDYAPTVILAVLIGLLGLYATTANASFLTERNLQGMLFFATALAFVSLGQLVVVVSGGFDLSVGPLAGLTVIVLSSFATGSADTLSVLFGFLLAVLAGIGVGLANGLLVRKAGLAPVLATLATFIVIAGISLWLRPSPAGSIAQGVIDVLELSIGPIPIAFLLALGLLVTCEWGLRRHRWGLELRAVGSDEVRAHRLGARVTRTKVGAYVACSVFAVLAGFMLASQVGIGQAALGRDYTLQSITAVVLGGASIFGGRGSFLGAFLGAFLLQEIINSSSFLDLGRAWGFWLPGALALVAAGAYSRARGVKAAALASGHAS